MMSAFQSLTPQEKQERVLADLGILKSNGLSLSIAEDQFKMVQIIFKSLEDSNRQARELAPEWQQLHDEYARVTHKASDSVVQLKVTLAEITFDYPKKLDQTRAQKDASIIKALEEFAENGTNYANSFMRQMEGAQRILHIFASEPINPRLRAGELMRSFKIGEILDTLVLIWRVISLQATKVAEGYRQNGRHAIVLGQNDNDEEDAELNWNIRIGDIKKYCLSLREYAKAYPPPH